MKNLKKFAGILLALVMVFSLTANVFAQTAGSGTEATITISNAAKGETYAVYKLFDATVTGDEGGSIAYIGTVPTELAAYFTADANGYVSKTAAACDENGDMSSDLRLALALWVKNQETATASAVSDGSELVFNVDYGYYVVTTTQGEQAITVTSTNPNATIVDKNSSTPKDLTKDVDDDDVFIGQTVTYTVKFITSNYNGAGTGSKKIVSYTIADTLPEFLTNVTVTSIIVDDDADAATTADQHDVTAQFVDKKIVIDWYDEENDAFRYDNGASVTITYTATVTDEAAIDGAGNTNKVTLTWQDKDGNDLGSLEDTETIFTYAIAVKKVDDQGVALADAVFQFDFYVKEVADTDGAYIYAGTEPREGLTNQLTTPATGEITIKGVESGEYTVTEFEAPDGYNKLLAPVTVTATKTGETTTNTTFYLDENGNISETETETVVTYNNAELAATAIVVVNKTGTELPSTGGIGTTIFYVLGSVLALAAIVLLISKKRMNVKG